MEEMPRAAGVGGADASGFTDTSLLHDLNNGQGERQDIAAKRILAILHKKDTRIRELVNASEAKDQQLAALSMDSQLAHEQKETALEQFRLAVRDLEDCERTAQDAVGMKDAEIAKLQGEVLELRGEREAMKDMLMHTKDESVARSRHADDMLQKHEAYVERIGVLTAELHTATALADRRGEENRRMKDELARTASDLQRLQNVVEHKGHTSEARIAELQEEARQQANQVSILEERCRMLHESSTAFAEDHRTSDAECIQLKKLAAELEAHRDGLMAEVKSLRSEKQRADDQVRELSAELHDVRHAGERLTSRAENLSRELQNVQNSTVGDRAAVDQYRAKCAALQATIDRQEGIISDTQGAMEDLKEAKHNADKEMVELKRLVDELQSDTNSQRVSIERQTSHHEMLVHETNERRAVQRDLESKICVLRERNTELESENRNLLDECEGLRAELNEMVSQKITDDCHQVATTTAVSLRLQKTIKWLEEENASKSIQVETLAKAAEIANGRVRMFAIDLEAAERAQMLAEEGDSWWRMRYAAEGNAISNYRTEVKRLKESLFEHRSRVQKAEMEVVAVREDLQTQKKKLSSSTFNNDIFRKTVKDKEADLQQTRARLEKAETALAKERADDKRSGGLMRVLREERAVLDHDVQKLKREVEELRERNAREQLECSRHKTAAETARKRAKTLEAELQDHHDSMRMQTEAMRAASHDRKDARIAEQKARIDDLRRQAEFNRERLDIILEELVKAIQYISDVPTKVKRTVKRPNMAKRSAHEQRKKRAEKRTKAVTEQEAADRDQLLRNMSEDSRATAQELAREIFHFDVFGTNGVSKHESSDDVSSDNDLVEVPLKPLELGSDLARKLPGAMGGLEDGGSGIPLSMLFIQLVDALVDRLNMRLD